MIEVLPIIFKDILLTLGSIAVGFTFLSILAYTYVEMFR